MKICHLLFPPQFSFIHLLVNSRCFINFMTANWTFLISSFFHSLGTTSTGNNVAARFEECFPLFFDKIKLIILDSIILNLICQANRAFRSNDEKKSSPCPIFITTFSHFFLLFLPQLSH